MRYRVTTERGGVRKVVWDITDDSPRDQYPSLAEISEAASTEFPGNTTEELCVVPVGGGDAVIMTVRRYA